MQEAIANRIVSEWKARHYRQPADGRDGIARATKLLVVGAPDPEPEECWAFIDDLQSLGLLAGEQFCAIDLTSELGAAGKPWPVAGASIANKKVPTKEPTTRRWTFSFGAGKQAVVDAPLSHPEIWSREGSFAETVAEKVRASDAQ